MDLILNDLNAAQRAAVTSPVDVLQVLAPPGSGKTKTLTSRVAYLLQHFHYQPSNIICLTFTVKSSVEMKERISKLVDHGTARKLILGTFHSVCRRYLIAYGHLIGINKDFGIADSSDQISIIKRLHKRLGLSIDPKAAQARISKSKSKGLSHHDLANELRKKKDVEQHEVVTLFEAYEEHLAISNLLDYDDLLLRCADLLRTHPSCVSNVEAVLVDEFQDTNVVQYDLLRSFAAHRNRMTTVGDPDQSIYGWRSAEVKNLKRMQRQFRDTLVVRLEDNYRSSGAILLAAQEVIEQDESRPQKIILPTHCPGTVPVLRKLPSAHIEAEWTVKEIQRAMALTGHLIEYSDIAVLLRSASLSRLLESAMGRAGIPYRMVGGQKFFDRAEIKILLDYLRVVSQPNNNDALVRIINIPARGIGAVTVKALLEEAEIRKETLWTLVRNDLKGYKPAKMKISKAAEQGLSVLTSMIIVIRSKMLDLSNSETPEGLLLFIIKKLDFQTYLKRNHPEDHETRWANVEELVAQASEYRVPSAESIAEEDGDEYLPQIHGLEQDKSYSAEEALSTFLANVALAAAVDVVKKEDGETGKSLSKVTISTIHAAKGLEWPVVFIPSAYEGSIPHSRAEDTDEERRLLYVAMTRAQALLYMSWPATGSQKNETKLSPFLSTKNVSRLLVNQGPIINAPVVVDISRILRRVCPPSERIEKEIQSLQTLRDDLWLLTEEESTEPIQKQWRKRDGAAIFIEERQSFKRHCKVEVSEPRGSCVVSKSTRFIGNSTTMDNLASFSYQGNNGFSSAAAQLQMARDSNGTIQKASSLEKRPCVGAERSHKRLKENTDLLEMWGRKGRAEVNKRDLSLAGLAYREDITVSPNKGLPMVAPKEVPKLLFPTIPPELAAHRLNPVIKASTRQEYVLLSSSPPTSGNKEEMHKNEMISATNEASPISKPAGAFQSASFPQPQSTSTLPRKILGVRRNMEGWSSRPSTSFKVPAMVPKQH